MWRYAIALTALGMILVPTVSQAQFKQGDFELTLGGTGTSDKDTRTGSFSINGSGGYFFTNELEVAVRQGIVWADGGSSWNGDTRIAADYHFNIDQFVPFVGANIGYQYGEDFSDTVIAGPEAGLKVFLNSTTFIQGIIAYEFDLKEGIDSGAFYYGLGLGVRL